jgi:transcriptional regulator with XRE-family HTH domain
VARQDVREILQAIRHRRGLSQAAAADRAGLSRSHFAKLESTGPDRRRLTDDVLEQLRRGLMLTSQEVGDLDRARSIEDNGPDRDRDQRERALWSARIVEELEAVRNRTEASLEALEALSDTPALLRLLLAEMHDLRTLNMHGVAALEQMATVQRAISARDRKLQVIETKYFEHAEGHAERAQEVLDLLRLIAEQTRTLEHRLGERLALPAPAPPRKARPR